MANRSSIAASDTTYHSFNDIELYEPAAPVDERCHGRASYDVRPSRPGSGDFVSSKIHRQDSGYESCSYSPRASISHSRPSVTRQNSTMSASRVRSRPSTRRSSKPYNSYNNGSLYQVKTYTGSQTNAAYYQFPALDVVEMSEAEAQMEVAPPLPQTTQYWTSDSTRRLEYAAIDAASRGVKGWIRKHLVPECITGPQHIPFDDDSGSVRRYRLELDEDDLEKDSSDSDRRSWRFGKNRK